MKVNKTQLGILAERIKMRSSERRALRESVLSYMEYHPLHTGVSAIPVSERSVASLVSGPFYYFSFSRWYVGSIAGVLTLVIITSVSLVAERAVPGDALYLVKVNVNEEIQSSLTWTPTQKVAWEVTRVERRIAEARLLAKEGKLTDEAQTELADTLREHTDTVNRELATLRETDAAGATVAQLSLESALDVQTAVLVAGATSTDANTDTQGIVDAVKAAKADVVASGESSISTPASYEGLSAWIEVETTRTQELFTTIDSAVTPEEKTDIERRIADIDRAIIDARKMYKSGSSEQAIKTQKKVLGDIQKLLLFMTDLDVRSSVSLESLVPIQLTNDELLTSITTALEGLKDAEVKIRTVETVPQDIEEKVKSGHEQLVAVIALIEKERSEGNITTAFQKVSDAEILATGLITLLEGRASFDAGVVVPSAEGASTTASSTSS